MSSELLAIISIGITLLLGLITIAGFFYAILTRMEDRISKKIDNSEESIGKKLDALSGKIAMIDSRVSQLETRIAVIEKGLSNIEAHLSRVTWVLGAEPHDRKEK